jgi:GPI mannosyltransferase 3
MIKKYKYHILSLLPFLITGIFSEGFIHPDEHFVTLEFLQTKISTFSRPEIFHWDYHERIRPWFQAFLYYIFYFLTPFKAPFNLAMSYRLLAGILGWFSLYLLTQKNTKRLLWISWTWFVPFLLARSSSESLSTSFFFLGAYFFTTDYSRKSSLLSGIFWGLSFITRYQMGIVIAVANLWYLYHKKSLRGLAWHSLMIFLIIGLGVVVDFWGYGEWVFSPYNYLYTNLVESRASAFGTDPFWYYLTQPIIKGGVFIPLVLIMGGYQYLKKNKSSFWLPVLISFIVIHSLIPHKEIRFLTFVYIALALLTFSQEQLPLLKKKGVFIFLLVLNFSMMSKTSLTPAEGLLGLYEQVGKMKTTVFYTPSNQHGQLFTFEMPFYEKVKRETVGFNLLQLNSLPSDAIVLTTNYQQFKYLTDHCRRTWLNYPEWVLAFNFFGWINRSAITALWSCAKN